MHSVELLKAVSPRPATGFVRPLAKHDVARVAELHEQVMPGAARGGGAARQTRLTRILLQHPWYRDSLPSLVYQDADGRVTGCLGVMSRPMRFRDRPVTAAVSHSFIVEPGNRSTLAALALARAYLSGPQDLSLAEGSQASRRIWEQWGGAVSLTYGLCWTRPLQPSRYLLSYLRKRGLPRAADWALRPVCRLLDTLAPLAARPFRFPAPPVPGTALDAGGLSELLPLFTRRRALRPHYDPGSFSWLLDVLGAAEGRGDLQRVMVRNERAEIIGWYLYYARPGEVGAVLQIGARDGDAGSVLEHLFHHARRLGAVAVSGQVDPALFQALSANHCVFHHDPDSSMLVHTRDPEILQAILRGDAFLSRLDGEWWISAVLG